jgi:hypothetical protein
VGFEHGPHQSGSIIAKFAAQWCKKAISANIMSPLWNMTAKMLEVSQESCFTNANMSLFRSMSINLFGLIRKPLKYSYVTEFALNYNSVQLHNLFFLLIFFIIECSNILSMSSNSQRINLRINDHYFILVISFLLKQKRYELMMKLIYSVT